MEREQERLTGNAWCTFYAEVRVKNAAQLFCNLSCANLDHYFETTDMNRCWSWTAWKVQISV